MSFSRNLKTSKALSSMKILVTGKNGQLASEIHSISSNSSASFIFLDSTQGDITNKEKLDRIVQENAIDIIINCAAYTAVDKAETEKEKAYAVNHLGVQNLVEICSKYGTRLIHISTDYVFDGKENSPYVTEHPVSPTGIYGKSKEQGEKAIIESTVSAVIIRTSWVFSSFGNNFVKTMLRLGSERDQLNVVNDQFGCPTYAKDLAVTCLKIALTSSWKKTPSIYHFSNSGKTSWYEFATEIMKQANLNCSIHPIPSEEYPTPAERPKYSVLETSKIQTDFNITIRHWKEALSECLESI